MWTCTRWRTPTRRDSPPRNGLMRSGTRSSWRRRRRRRRPAESGGTCCAPPPRRSPSPRPRAGSRRRCPARLWRTQSTSRDEGGSRAAGNGREHRGGPRQREGMRWALGRATGATRHGRQCDRAWSEGRWASSRTSIETNDMMFSMKTMYSSSVSVSASPSVSTRAICAARERGALGEAMRTTAWRDRRRCEVGARGDASGSAPGP